MFESKDPNRVSDLMAARARAEEEAAEIYDETDIDTRDEAWRALDETRLYPVSPDPLPDMADKLAARRRAEHEREVVAEMQRTQVARQLAESAQYDPVTNPMVIDELGADLNAIDWIWQDAAGRYWRFDERDRNWKCWDTPHEEWSAAGWSHLVGHGGFRRVAKAHWSPGDLEIGPPPEFGEVPMSTDPFADEPALTGSERATLRETIDWWDGRRRGPGDPSRKPGEFFASVAPGGDITVEPWHGKTQASMPVDPSGP